jgi:Tat protein secretion system quality control protein TatD with DNase activity
MFDCKSVKNGKFDPNDKSSEFAVLRERNEPCTCVQIIEAIAMLKGVTVKKVAAAAYENSVKVFFNRSKDAVF